MNNRSKTYLLIVAVLIVWGLIAYKIFQHLKPSSDENLTVKTEKKRNPKTDSNLDYKMHSGYRDPFFGTLKKPERQEIKNGQEKRNISPKKTDLNPIPSVSVLYRGLVNPLANKKECVFIIEINGKTQLLKAGDSSDGCTLISGDNKKVWVLNSGKRMEIPIMP